MKYTQIPIESFEQIQLNAGILVDNFNPQTGVIGNLLGATTGGINFTDSPEYSDFGEDIDNCPKNTMELKRLNNREVSMSGTFVTISATTAKRLVGSSDVDEGDNRHIIPRDAIYTSDFQTLWWIGDYSDVNNGDNAGFVAIKMYNALNTGGFQIQSTDKGKGQFAFTFTGHYSIKAQDVVPYEIWVKQGTSLLVPTIAPESGTSVLFDTPVSDMQTDLVVGDDGITGTLHFIEGGIAESGPLAGDGWFMALKFSADWDKYTSVKVGLEPSMGTGMVEIINDPDKNGVFKIANREQKFVILATDGDETVNKVFSLADLTLEGEA